ncbi:hypothetical protein PENSUB_4309 [Penicillium subrubescens]|uniref:Uncharacterized protein n=1 Tax=Penicillium subrubescens TaxID=1316194 RepID=A0A1Q5UR80_9EURO|nr:hypothetical protein PENSUB_4309 [Penicillium subrubescens]
MFNSFVKGLAARFSWASPQVLTESEALVKQRGLAPGDQYVFATCPRTGLPPIIPFPLPPPGFVVPPAGVPNPKTPCKEDYTKTSCKDCKALEGWCTVGDNAGCPCKEECPADDKKPKCSDDGCKGDDKGACTIPYESDINLLQGANDGCACYELASVIFTIGSKSQAEKSEKIMAELSKYLKDHEGEGDKPKEPKEVKCSSTEYSKAVDVDISFMQKIADKFCDGDMSKKRSQDLTNKDVSSSAYDKYKFHLEFDPGKNCKTDCKATFKSIIGKCEGYNSHSIQLEGSAKFDCDASYSYKIDAPEKPKPAPTPDPGFEQHGLQERKCHSADQFGGHGDVRGSEISMAATGCAGISDDKAKLKEGSEAVKLQSTYGGTKMQFTMSWIKNCKGPEQDARYPFGEPHNLGNTCWQLLLDDWQKCNNGGAGGSIDYSCVRYDFRPTHD